jgi:hypothetical protein
MVTAGFRSPGTVGNGPSSRIVTPSPIDSVCRSSSVRSSSTSCAITRSAVVLTWIPRVGHVWPSTQADNLRRMASRGRGGGRRWWVRRWSGLSRPERAARSRALAAAVRNGWDEQRVRAVLLSIDPAQIPLF